jgi:hypothetical protein
VSHSKERHEKICLNCNAELTGRYCHVCGQENIEPKETVWGLVSHFFYDITHFDGKFFSTTKYLVTKPGFLPKEYIKGRRASYLHPIRMYVFSSAIFFLIFFSLYKPKDFINGKKKEIANISNQIDSAKQIDAFGPALLKNAGSREDSIMIMASLEKAKESFLAPKGKKSKPEKAGVKKDSAQTSSSDTGSGYRYHGGAATTAKPDTGTAAKHDTVAKKDKAASSDDEDDEEDADKPQKIRPGKTRRITWFDAADKYKSVEEYDSVQKTLPKEERDGFWARSVARRNIILEEKARHSDDGLIGEITEVFMHMLPYMLFVSLPLYAFFMWLLYARHKQFYYVDHGIFFIYLYIFTFIFLLLYFTIQKVHSNMHWNWLGWIEGLLLLAGTFYTYKAMRNFYGQSRAMTILKFVLLNIMAFFALVFLFVIFGTLTLFRL